MVNRIAWPKKGAEKSGSGNELRIFILRDAVGENQNPKNKDNSVKSRAGSLSWGRF